MDHPIASTRAHLRNPAETGRLGQKLLALNCGCKKHFETALVLPGPFFGDKYLNSMTF
jgi:hypothetical protein